MCKKKEIDKEVIEEWKRFLESEEFQHDPECGTLLIAQHFAEWQKEQMVKDAVDGRLVDDGGDMILVVPSLPIITRTMDDGDKVKVILVKEE